MSETAIALRWARRELRGGIAGFRVFLLCLALGVAAIAAVGILRASIQTGLADQGAVILGGDARLGFSYRHAEPEELAWMAAHATRIAEVVDFRSMAVVGEGEGAERALTQVKAVDGAYPIYGAVMLDPAMPLAEVFEGAGGLPGAAMDPVLADRLGLATGDTFRLGDQSFRLMARLVREPDSASGGFGLGPRTLVRATALAGSGLLSQGSLYSTEYRLALPEGAGLAALKAEAETAFAGKGMRWQDRRSGAPGTERFIDRLAAFLVLVGLAGLAVGGVGVATAVRSYIEGEVPVIATLKALGASQRLILTLYFAQIGALALAGVTIGIVLGAGVPLALAPLIEARLPFPAAIGFHARPVLEAGFYGLLVAAIFTLWPLSRTAAVRAAALFRETGGIGRGWPGTAMTVVIAGLVAVLVGAAAWFSGRAGLALGIAGGVAGALGLLALAALGLRRLARAVGGARILRGRPALRLAFGALGGPGRETATVVLSLGLSLTVLAAMGQIDANLRAAISGELPEVAPSYFVLDIQNDQIDPFRALANAEPGVRRVETAPMLRGIITEINGRAAREIAGDHWVLRGDRGVTYSARPPEGTTITEGAWWPADYTGPAQVSFSAEEAAELGLKLGDRLTVNVLGRDIVAEITSFRIVDFSNAGLGFVMSMDPAALAGAPHTHIATIYSDTAHEAALLRAVATAFPNITAIRVRDAIERVSEMLGAIAAATAWAAGAALLTGFVVLIGAAAAGERGRVYEAAVLKTLGATRGRILASFALRSALTGAAAGVVALVSGGLAAWAVITFVMEADFHFDAATAVAIVAGGVAATLAAGFAFALRPLGARPARVLRAQE